MTTVPPGAPWDGIDLWGPHKQFRQTLTESEEAEFEDWLDTAREADLERRRADLEERYPDVQLDGGLTAEQFEDFPDIKLDALIDFWDDEAILELSRIRRQWSVEADAMIDGIDAEPERADWQVVRDAMDELGKIAPDAAPEAATALANQLRARLEELRDGEGTIGAEEAEAVLDRLKALEQTLIQLAGLVDAQTDLLKAHHGNLGRQGLITTDSTSRAKDAKTYQDTLITFASLMADIASVEDFFEGLADAVGRNGVVDDSVIEFFDSWYEGLKDLESMLNTALEIGGGDDAPQIPIHNDLFGGVPAIDGDWNPMLKLQTLKGHLSDVISLAEGLQKGEGLDSKTAGQLVFRVLKSYAEWEQQIRELQIQELEASLEAEDVALATPFLLFMAYNEQARLAEEALAAVRQSRLELHEVAAYRFPGIGASEWPAPPTNLSTMDALLSRVATDAEDLNTSMEAFGAGGHASPYLGANPVSVAEQRRADVLARQQVLTSRSAGIDYFEERTSQLRAEQTAIRQTLQTLRGKKGDVVDTLTWRSNLWNKNRPPTQALLGSSRLGEFVDAVSTEALLATVLGAHRRRQLSPAQLDAAIRDLEVRYRSVSNELSDFERDQSRLESELRELAILDYEIGRLDRDLPDLRSEREAQRLTDAIDEVVAEEEAKSRAAADAATAAGRTFFSGIWIIAAIVAVVVVGALALGFGVFGGSDRSDEVTEPNPPVAASLSRPTSAEETPDTPDQPAEAVDQQPAPSAQTRTPDGQVPELPAGWEAPPPFDRFETDVDDPTMRYSSGGSLWAWSVWQEPELISELEEVDADFAISQLATIPAGTTIPAELIITVDCSSDPCTYSTVYGAVAGDLDRRVTVPLTLDGLELTGTYVPIDDPNSPQLCTRSGTYRLEVSDLTPIGNRLVPDYIRGERTLQTACEEYTLNETITINGRYLFRGSYADQQTGG